jgi:hypothetical protein
MNHKAFAVKYSYVCHFPPMYEWTVEQGSKRGGQSVDGTIILKYMWIYVIWLIVGTSGWLMWAQRWGFGFYKRRGSFFVPSACFNLAWVVLNSIICQTTYMVIEYYLLCCSNRVPSKLKWVKSSVPQFDVQNTGVIFRIPFGEKLLYKIK